MLNIYQWKILALSCFSRELGVSFSPKGVAAHLSPLLVLTYTLFTCKISCSILVYIHLYIRFPIYIS